MAIVIYTKPGCPYCQRARDHYNENGIEFIEYDAQNDREAAEGNAGVFGRRSDRSGIVENGEYVASGWGDPPRG